MSTDTKDVLIKILNNIDVLNEKINNLDKKLLVDISEPCKFPNVTIEIDKLITETHLTKNDIKGVVEKFKSKLETNSKKLLLASDYRTHFLILVCLVNLRNSKGSNLKGFQYAMLLILIRNYCNLMNKYFKTVCVPENFLAATDYLSKKHLFVKYNGPSKAIVYLTTQLSDKYRQAIMSYDIDGIFKLIYEGRHRLNQSIKSFYNAYLKAYKERKAINDTGNVGPTTNLDLNTKDSVIDKVTDQIITYRVKDVTLIDLINKMTYTKRSQLEMLINEIHNRSIDEIKEVYTIMLKDVKDIFPIFSDKFATIKFIRKLMSIKYTKQDIYFKKVAIDLIRKIIDSNQILKNYYDKLNTGGKTNFNLSFALYLGLYLHKFVTTN